MPSVTRHPSSYRDPSGYIFYHNDILYRQVNKVYRDQYDLLNSSGLYKSLTEKNLLVPHREINENFTGSPDWSLTLQPEKILFISYPYEWCFNMLKDAALATIDVAEEALRHNMMLKDASAYNVQWHNGKMLFIDTLSFEAYDETKPWIAYRQFCEHFFAPLALMHYLKEPLQPLLIGYPDGIPLPLARKLLPGRSRFNLNTFLHLHLHGKMAGKKNAAKNAQPYFSRQKMNNLLRSLGEAIKSFSLDEPSGVWSAYYEEAQQRKNYLEPKKKIVEEWVGNLAYASAIDVGANEGAFSDILARNESLVLSTDLDHFSVNELYKRVKEEGAKNIYPLIIDFSNPSPALGFNSKERDSFLNRTSVDLVVALAVIHHLAIGKNIPLESIAEMFSRLGKMLIIEFVPKEDEKIQLMLQHKNDVYDWYSKEQFLKCFSKAYNILDSKMPGASNREIFLMETKTSSGLMH
jgi:2-polyprenyl-3-methyl-5-hydroxy-6-metoxy-1,4-benzoquinol methylase